MYHYVRNNEEFEYDVFSRKKEEFFQQVSFLKKKMHPCSISDKDEIDYYLKSQDQSFILTFDDGYKDHLFCAETLNQIGLAGIFFPSCNIFNGRLLDVNLLHLILGNKDFKKENFLEVIQSYINLYDLQIKSCIFNYYGSSVKDYLEFVIPKRFDSVEISAIKFLLQRDIKGASNRKLILDDLFKKFYRKDHCEYVKDFYLTTEEMIYMKKLGSKFGSHGLTHKHLNALTKSEQNNEIIKSFNILMNKGIIISEDIKFLCYPFGSFNADTIELLVKNKIDYGFTLDINAANLNKTKSVFTLPRWDTNHFWDNFKSRPKLPFLKKD